jgi:hypothetical protein
MQFAAQLVELPELRIQEQDRQEVEQKRFHRGGDYFGKRTVTSPLRSRNCTCMSAGGWAPLTVTLMRLNTASCGLEPSSTELKLNGGDPRPE